MGNPLYAMVRDESSGALVRIVVEAYAPAPVIIIALVRPAETAIDALNPAAVAAGLTVTSSGAGKVNVIVGTPPTGFDFLTASVSAMPIGEGTVVLSEARPTTTTTQPLDIRNGARAFTNLQFLLTIIMAP